MDKGDRSFTVVNVEGSPAKKKSVGRYISKDPSGAAKKAASQLFRKKSAKKITFTIRETTSGSAKKTYDYVAEKELLKKPVVRVINGVIIENKYKISVKAK